MSAVLATLPEQPIELSVNTETFLTTVRYQGGEFNVPGFSAEDFPLPKEVTKPTIVFSVPTNVLFPAMKAASAIAGEDDLRPVLSAVALDVNAEGITFVATDGKMLYRYIYVHGVPFLTEGSPGIILVPKRIISAFEVPFRNAETVELRHDGSQLVLTANGVTFSVRDIEGKYPNYNSVIPNANPYHLTLSVPTFLAAIKRVALMASDASRLIGLRYDASGLVLFGEDRDYATSAKENLVPLDCTMPEGFAIGFNSSHILTELASISTENVRLELSAPERAIVVKEDATNSTLLELLMPMALNG